MEADGALVVQSDPSRCIAWAVMLGVVAIAGLLLGRVQRFRLKGLAIFICSLALGIFVIPEIANESVRVDKSGLNCKGGYWKPVVHIVTFAKLAEAQEEVRTTGSGTRQRSSIVWVFLYTDGGRSELILSDLLAANRSAIRNHLEGVGITFKQGKGTN